MTEEEAQAWLISELAVSRETMDRIDAFRALVIAEASSQNLISTASIPQIWARHIVDSAQLLLHAPAKGRWLDLGTGAGFPGIVVALLRDRPITLVESRRKRISFLQEVVDQFDLHHADLVGSSLESMETDPYSVISARAFAPLPKLLTLAHRFSRPKTVWLLPKGRSAREEVESVTGEWAGVFHVKQSLTDPEAHVIVAQGVTRKGRR
jgi:16S rRNA (guanine527-N7)-methyltransferase